MKIIATRLKDGQDLFKEIKRVAAEHNIQAGVILSAVGGLHESTIRVPVFDQKVKYIHPSNLEINGLHGTVSAGGSHLHMVVSDLDGKVWGGHLKDGCIVRNTCELVIGILPDVRFTREPDSDTGFDEIVIK